MNGVGRFIERALFASRWLLVPLYLGLVLLLVMIAVTFFRELLHAALAFPSLGGSAIIVLSLSLVDLALVAALIVMVMLSSYENFVSTLDITTTEKNLAWLGKLDFGSIKLKVALAIVAISSINLLRAVLDAEETPDDKLMWLVIIQLTFLVTAFVLSAMDRMSRTDH